MSKTLELVEQIRKATSLELAQEIMKIAEKHPTQMALTKRLISQCCAHAKSEEERDMFYRLYPWLHAHPGRHRQKG